MVSLILSSKLKEKIHEAGGERSGRGEDEKLDQPVLAPVMIFYILLSLHKH